MTQWCSLSVIFVEQICSVHTNHCQACPVDTSTIARVSNFTCLSAMTARSVTVQPRFPASSRSRSPLKQLVRYRILLVHFLVSNRYNDKCQSRVMSRSVISGSWSVRCNLTINSLPHTISLCNVWSTFNFHRETRNLLMLKKAMWFWFYSISRFCQESWRKGLNCAWCFTNQNWRCCKGKSWTQKGNRAIETWNRKRFHFVQYESSWASKQILSSWRADSSERSLDWASPRTRRL